MKNNKSAVSGYKKGLINNTLAAACLELIVIFYCGAGGVSLSAAMSSLVGF